MIEIRNLTEVELVEAVKLRISCWTEELAGKAENKLTFSDEMNEWTEWRDSADEYNDVRILIGAFENGEMLGVAFASFAETFDIPEKGIELNGLWVYPKHRNRGISLLLLKYVFEFYAKFGINKLAVYNHHYSKSNSYYPKFGAKVIKQVHQMGGKTLIDVFIGDIAVMKENIEKSLKHYISE